MDLRRDRTRAGWSAVCAALVALGLLIGWSAAPAAAATAAPTAARAAAVPDPGAAEADFTARINALRASKGLGPLAVDGELVREARSWAANMAGQGRIFHTSDLGHGISANWVKLGENVGVGADVAVLFQAFVDSPTHYDNLVDPRYTTVGVGVVVTGDRIFTAHRFMAVAPPAAPPAAPAPAPEPVVTQPPPPSTTLAPTTTVPPTTVPPTTTTTTIPRPPDAPAPKLGPIERISEVIAAAS